MNIDGELHLSKLCQEIGSISDSNCHYTAGLQTKIDETGYDLEDLTVGVFITIHRQFKKVFNSTYPRTETPQTISVETLLARQETERGFTPLPLETDLLIKRVKDGGYSGQFLADAFISSYRTDEPFNHPLGKIMKLDNEAQRLFFEILCIRLIPGWSDDGLYEVEQQIKEIIGGKS